MFTIKECLPDMLFFLWLLEVPFVFNTVNSQDYGVILSKYYLVFFSFGITVCSLLSSLAFYGDNSGVDLSFSLDSLACFVETPTTLVWDALNWHDYAFGGLPLPLGFSGGVLTFFSFLCSFTFSVFYWLSVGGSSVCLLYFFYSFCILSSAFACAFASFFFLTSSTTVGSMSIFLGLPLLVTLCSNLSLFVSLTLKASSFLIGFDWLNAWVYLGKFYIILAGITNGISV